MFHTTIWAPVIFSIVSIFNPYYWQSATEPLYILFAAGHHGADHHNRQPWFIAWVVTTHKAPTLFGMTGQWCMRIHNGSMASRRNSLMNPSLTSSWTSLSGNLFTTAGLSTSREFWLRLGGHLWSIRE
jgi:hypothetical protein